jgi:hypothetical protein
MFKEPRNRFQGIDSFSLRYLAGRYNNYGCRSGPLGNIGGRNRFPVSLNVYKFGLCLVCRLSGRVLGSPCWSLACTCCTWRARWPTAAPPSSSCPTSWRRSSWSSLPRPLPPSAPGTMMTCASSSFTAEEYKRRI